MSAGLNEESETMRCLSGLLCCCALQSTCRCNIKHFAIGFIRHVKIHLYHCSNLKQSVVNLNINNSYLQTLFNVGVKYNNLIILK